MEIHKFFFKLAVSLLLLLAVYFQTSLQQQLAASAPAVSIALASEVSIAPAADYAFAPATSDSPQGPILPPKEVVAVRALLELMDNKPKGYFSETSCNGDTFSDFITCNCALNNNKTCRVTILYFPNQKMEGSIPKEIGDLSHLTTLYMSENMLQGTIPESFANLSRLETIFLNDNRLEGSLTSLQQMKSLRRIYLYNNFFSDTIPSQLGALPSLRYVYLDNNLLTGEIPKQLGNISSLQLLSLSDNKLGGELPRDLGNLTVLNYLDLSNNEFSGEWPLTFNWEYIWTLDVRGNNLSGKIPDVSKMQQLEYLSLAGNNFEAPLPKTFPESLYVLHVTNLIGLEEGSQLPDVSKLSSLRYLTLRNCSLTGPIHPSIWKLNLTYLDLSFNKLNGSIPGPLDYEPPQYFYLRSNKLSGSIPKWQTANGTLNVDVSENNFTGLEIPTDNISHNINLFACCSGSNIRNEDEQWLYGAHYCPNEKHRNDNLYINCGGNSTIINGFNYEADAESEGGSTFFLSDSKRWGYSSMGKFLRANNDLYILSKTCNLTMADAPLYQTARVAPISLTYYGFCFKKNSYIVRLHFAEIAWDASQVSGFKKRRAFNVKIQDKIELSNFNIEAAAEGAEINITKEFIVDVNDTLRIHLYWSGEGSTEFPTTYYGPLISAISVSPVPKKHKKLSTAAIAGIGASATVCIILTLVLFKLLGWFGGEKLQDEELKGKYPGLIFNFREIKAATQNFDASNRLGGGGFGTVYKGVLPNGTEIAVKQLSTRSAQGIHEFVNEIGTITAQQHPNLVKLLGFCVEDQLLLIYEYMKNNSLHHALFGPEKIKLKLNWPTRVKICLGIAKGLAYLHEESNIKIIHRDIKPQNILLDQYLNAKISDFGFAKLLEDGNTIGNTRLAGTIGYLAPEYAMQGHLTTKADVFSFGVVTLEIVSGKNNANFTPNEQAFSLHSFAYFLQRQGKLLELVDPNLGSEYPPKEASIILELAVLCINQFPTLRPTMSEAVKILEGKSKIKIASTSESNTMDNFTAAKALAVLSASPESGRYSQGEASGTTISHSTSKEIELSNFFTDDSAKTVR